MLKKYTFAAEKPAFSRRKTDSSRRKTDSSLRKTDSSRRKIAFQSKNRLFALKNTFSVKKTDSSRRKAAFQRRKVGFSSEKCYISQRLFSFHEYSASGQIHLRGLSICTVFSERSILKSTHDIYTVHLLQPSLKVKRYSNIILSSVPSILVVLASLSRGIFIHIIH